MEREEISAYIRELVNSGPIKIILSRPDQSNTNFKKTTLIKQQNGYQIEQFTEQQVFHRNIEIGELEETLSSLIFHAYKQVNGFTEQTEHILMVSKKGRVTRSKKQLTQAVTEQKNHNRKKTYLLEEGRSIPALIDMGIFTKEGKIVHAMYDKYRQINRFIEIIDDAIKNDPKEKLHIVDFGCGKSYLTFILYYYLTEIRNREATITGLDLKKDVIEACNRTAQQYGYKGLHFEVGDIKGYQTAQEVDMVITLHACDTATDFALYQAIMWNARMIFSVPCCQHELNGQLESDHFAILSRYGIIKERFSALATDAIRGNLLEYCGYKTQLLEFVDLSHTPKNVLIRAVKRKHPDRVQQEKRRQEAQGLMEEFHFNPMLYALLQEHSFAPES
ncbi:MAG: class I SAM-dependent methyltransferase [Lachnospiraceae bacterium]